MNPNQPPRDIDDSAFGGQKSLPLAPPPRPGQGASPFSSMPDAGPDMPPPPPQPSKPVVAPQALPVTPVAPQPVLQHLPADIAAKIAETPQQNSKEVEAKAEHHHTNASKLKSLVSIILFIVCIVGAAFVINQFIFQSYFVDGTSMTPTLQNNDRLVISKVERTAAHLQGRPYIPERGQIVVLDSSIVGANGQDEQLIKRVMGLPGDKIHIQDGVVTVTNDQFPDGFNADRTLGLTLAPTYSAGSLDFTINPSQVFVMGDNRAQNGSYDSRAFGPIDVKNLEGRLWARILPINDAKLFSFAAPVILPGKFGF